MNKIYQFLDTRTGAFVLMGFLFFMAVLNLFFFVDGMLGEFRPITIINGLVGGWIVYLMVKMIHIFILERENDRQEENE